MFTRAAFITAILFTFFFQCSNGNEDCEESSGMRCSSNVHRAGLIDKEANCCMLLCLESLNCKSEEGGYSKYKDNKDYVDRKCSHMNTGSEKFAKCYVDPCSG